MRHLFLVLALTGCGTGDFGDDPATDCNEDNEGCGPGDCDGEGAKMLPGSDCIACHSEGNFEEDEDEGFYSAAGTVFTDLDGTDGQADAVVRITDADGQVIELTSNSVGNFYTTKELVFPINAEIEADGEVRTMSTEVETGACSSCHACEGEAGGKLFGP